MVLRRRLPAAQHSSQVLMFEGKNRSHFRAFTNKLALDCMGTHCGHVTYPFCDTDDAARYGAVALSLVSPVGAAENPRHDKLCYDSPAWRTLCSAVPLYGYQQPGNRANS